MSKNLVIVESPSKSKTIEKYLGKDYKVVSSLGHIRDLTTSGKFGFGVDLEDNFKPNYEIIKGTSLLFLFLLFFQISFVEHESLHLCYFHNHTLFLSSPPGYQSI